MKSDIFYAIGLGLLIGIMLNALPWSDAEQYRRAKRECEKTLPRNQQCKIVGVPQL